MYIEASESHGAHAVMANTVNNNTRMLPEGFVLLGEGQIPSCEIPIPTPAKKAGERVKSGCIPEVSPLATPEGLHLLQRKIPQAHRLSLVGHFTAHAHGSFLMYDCSGDE